MLGSLQVQIVTSPNHGCGDGFLLSKLAWHWRKAGHQISVGSVAEIPEETDIAILHIDRTRVGTEDVPTNPRGCRFMNERVLDISKRSYSGLKLELEDEWRGAVMIKSDLNCAGTPEWYQSGRPLALRLRRKLSRVSWRLARCLPPETYPVVAGLKDVPSWVWGRQDLLVERFVPEREEDLYCVRVWVYFGAEGYGYKLYGTEPTVKAGTIVRAERLEAPPPASILNLAKKMGLDFGKIDYVEVDGEAVLLDINKTPTVTSATDNPRLRRMAKALGELGKNL